MRTPATLKQMWFRAVLLIQWLRRLARGGWEGFFSLKKERKKKKRKKGNKGTTSICFLGWKSVPSLRTFWLQYSSKSFKGMYLWIRDALNCYKWEHLLSNKLAVPPIHNQPYMENIVQTLWPDKERACFLFPNSRRTFPTSTEGKTKKTSHFYVQDGKRKSIPIICTIQAYTLFTLLQNLKSPKEKKNLHYLWQSGRKK